MFTSYLWYYTYVKTNVIIQSVSDKYTRSILNILIISCFFFMFKN